MFFNHIKIKLYLFIISDNSMSEYAFIKQKNTKKLKPIDYPLYNKIYNFQLDYKTVFDNFNSLIEKDEIKEVQSKVIEIKQIMLDNIEKIIERGESLESLQKKSNELETHAVIIRKKAKSMNSCCH